MDLGVWLLPTAYTLRHARGYGRSALRSWQLQGSKDGLTWVVLSGNGGGTTSIAEPPEARGPGADSGSGRIGSRPALGKKVAPAAYTKICPFEF